MKSMWLVQGSSGEYSEAASWPVAVWPTAEEAQGHAQAADLEVTRISREYDRRREAGEKVAPPGWTESPEACAWPVIPWSALDWRACGNLPDFCRSWEGFGRIVEACRGRQLPMMVFAEPSGTYSATVDMSRGVSQPSAPEALALAFCLASQVEVPAEWLPEGGANA